MKKKKALTFRDDLFKRMRNRKFFDAFMNEPCPMCIEFEKEIKRLRQYIRGLQNDN
jgi:hypothetical protein